LFDGNYFPYPRLRAMLTSEQKFAYREYQALTGTPTLMLPD
jgi:hypothetical protein